MKYLTVEQVLRIHARAISQSGGDAGVRDLGLVESAAAQPRASFRSAKVLSFAERKATFREVISGQISKQSRPETEHQTRDKDTAAGGPG